MHLWWNVLDLDFSSKTKANTSTKNKDASLKSGSCKSHLMPPASVQTPETDSYLMMDGLFECW